MVFNIGQHIQHKPTEIGHENFKGKLMAQGARSDSRSLFAAHNPASGEKTTEKHKLQVSMYGVC